uniref:Retrotransposon Copia-like N-terminal domain-containing protein n=1 Tax=Solanum lycopersicum TaxID=4081 RepID=A0A3Q7EDF6_SOLLC
MLYVKNKDGALRIFIDNMQLNKVIIYKKKYQIRKIDDLFYKLQCASHLLKINLKSGYKVRDIDIQNEILRILLNTSKFFLSTYLRSRKSRVQSSFNMSFNCNILGMTRIFIFIFDKEEKNQNNKELRSLLIYLIDCIDFHPVPYGSTSCINTLFYFDKSMLPSSVNCFMVLELFCITTKTFLGTKFFLSAAMALDSLPNPTNEATLNFWAPSNNIISLNNNNQLTITNYQSWQYQWETVITSYDFLPFINEPPSTTAISVYKRQDHLIRSFMVASLSPEIIPFVTDNKTSYALWHNLATTYTKPSHSLIMSLREDLNTIQKGNLYITVYFKKIKEICTKIASIGVHISADDVFLHVVQGLSSEYDSIASALRARETAITFE